MKIGIDARWIFRELSGIGAYTRELLRHLIQLDRDNDYVIFFQDPVVEKRTTEEIGLAQAPNFTACRVPYGVFSIAGQWQFARVLKERKLDLYHSTNYMIPLPAFPRRRPGAIRCVTSIHDLIPLMHPEYAPRSKKSRLFFVYRLLMREIALRTDFIITGSRSARDDLVRCFKLTPDRAKRIRIVYDGVSARFGAAPAPPPRTEVERTVLYVGRRDPYKNLTGLIEAFARLREDCRFPVKLRVVGPLDPRYPEAPLRAAELGLRDAIVWDGYLTDEQLVEAYRQADLFVLPSRYEGFGLPAIEAMASGVPVICSNKGALPEVVGNAAIMVQPDDTVGLAECMRRVLTHPRLAKDMIAKGLQQAARFSWTETARLTLEVYRDAMK